MCQVPRGIKAALWENPLDNREKSAQSAILSAVVKTTKSKDLCVGMWERGA